MFLFKTNSKNIPSEEERHNIKYNVSPSNIFPKIGRSSQPFLGKCQRVRHSEVSSLVDANNSKKACFSSAS